MFQFLQIAGLNGGKRALNPFCGPVPPLQFQQFGNGRIIEAFAALKMNFAPAPMEQNLPIFSRSPLAFG
ncbi:MAG: hypothetical protein SPK75_07835 [Victivallales bacterium]|nr:hypothetical protein [Victivallales bacterium]